ncbi:MAG: hypothetical protein IPM53_30035 [Anaerolineaceae bacterium]|nr:hypothetical protein [Anaerolineaceae bacterium]
MLTPALTIKKVRQREQERQLEQVLTLLQEATVAVLLSLFIPLVFITLLSFIQNMSFPWLPLLGIMDELVFLTAALIMPCLMLALIKYHYWRFSLFAWGVFVRHIRRSGRRPPAAESLTSLLDSQQTAFVQARITAFIHQLRSRLVKRPPRIWTAGKAPLALFQQANLLLAP